ncbi:hypothetical protein DFH06DRAFT_608684 [Mycena polygramma]|nr:hypothetical protein DFH06DRAFT_608684 [Mycena polygramma]
MRGRTRDNRCKRRNRCTMSSKTRMSGRHTDTRRSSSKRRTTSSRRRSFRRGSRRTRTSSSRRMGTTQEQAQKAYRSQHRAYMSQQQQQHAAYNAFPFERDASAEETHMDVGYAQPLLYASHRAPAAEDARAWSVYHPPRTRVLPASGQHSFPQSHGHPRYDSANAPIRVPPYCASPSPSPPRPGRPPPSCPSQCASRSASHIPLPRLHLLSLVGYGLGRRECASQQQHLREVRDAHLTHLSQCAPLYPSWRSIWGGGEYAQLQGLDVYRNAPSPPPPRLRQPRLSHGIHARMGLSVDLVSGVAECGMCGMRCLWRKETGVWEWEYAHCAVAG